MRACFDTLKRRDLGNTVLIVEHDEETGFGLSSIWGRAPAKYGGRIVATGIGGGNHGYEESITGQYLSRRRQTI